MALNDVYQVQHIFRDFDNKVMQNDYFYYYETLRGLGITDDAEALAVAWQASVFAVQQPQIPNNFTTTGIRVTNLFNPSDQYEIPLSLAGGRAVAGNDLMPTFNSVKVIMSPQNGAVKKGRKMLAGLFENDQVNGILTLVGSTSFALRAASLTLWVADSVVLGVKAFKPIVVKRVRTGTPGNYVYRLPENNSELIYGTVQAAVLSAIVTTQNSRKY